MQRDLFDVAIGVEGSGWSYHDKSLTHLSELKMSLLIQKLDSDIVHASLAPEFAAALHQGSRTRTANLTVWLAHLMPNECCSGFGFRKRMWLRLRKCDVRMHVCRTSTSLEICLN